MWLEQISQKPNSPAITDTDTDWMLFIFYPFFWTTSIQSRISQKVKHIYLQSLGVFFVGIHNDVARVSDKKVAPVEKKNLAPVLNKNLVLVLDKSLVLVYKENLLGECVLILFALFVCTCIIHNYKIFRKSPKWFFSDYAKMER